MKLKRLGAPLAILAAAAISLTACAANEGSTPTTTSAKPSNLSGTLNGIGSSAQGAAQTVWAAGFQNANPKVTVNYDPQGSGAGRTSFISGAADFAGSDAALKATELAGTFAGCARRVQGHRPPRLHLPDRHRLQRRRREGPQARRRHHRGHLLGRHHHLERRRRSPPSTRAHRSRRLRSRSCTAPTTRAPRRTSPTTSRPTPPTVWTKPAAQTFPYQVGDAAKGTSGVADATKNAKNSITYIDESGSAGLSIAQLKVGNTFTKISADGAAAVVAASPIASGRETNDLAIAINRKDTSKGAWPLVLVSYIVACQQYKDAAKADLVKGYVDYIISERGPEGRHRAGRFGPAVERPRLQGRARPSPASSNTSPLGLGAPLPGPGGASLPPPEPANPMREARNDRRNRRCHQAEGEDPPRRPCLLHQHGRRRVADPRRSWPPSRSSSSSRAIPALFAGAGELPNNATNFWSWVWPLVFGTIWAALIALIIATPLSIGIALFISHYAPRRVAQTLGYIIDLLAAVPSVVFGLWGIATLAPFVQPFYAWLGQYLGWIPLFAPPVSGTGRTILTAAIVLAVMVIPIMTAICREIFLQTPRLHEEAALALGATRWEMVSMAVLPFARVGHHLGDHARPRPRARRDARHRDGPLAGAHREVRGAAGAEPEHDRREHRPAVPRGHRASASTRSSRPASCCSWSRC